MFSITEKIGESSNARPEASYRATLLFLALEKRYQTFLHSPEPHLMGRTQDPFSAAAVAQSSSFSVASERPSLESGTWWSGRMCAARGWSYRRTATRSPQRTDFEASYLKEANRGQPAPHGEDEKAEREELSSARRRLTPCAPERSNERREKARDFRVGLWSGGVLLCAGLCET